MFKNMENNINLLTELYDIKRQNIDWEIKLENNNNLNKKIDLFSDSFGERFEDLSKTNNKFKITLSPNQKRNNSQKLSKKESISVDTSDCNQNNQSLNANNEMTVCLNSGDNLLPDSGLGFGYRSDGIKNVEQYVERRKINGITWYYCKWFGCDYGSNKSNHLVRHVRTHTGEKPYPCHWPNCDKKFTDSWKRKDHILSHNRKLNSINPTVINAKADNNLKLFVEMLNQNKNICEPIDNDIEGRDELTENLDDINREDVLENELNMFIPEVIVNEMDSSGDGMNNNLNTVPDEPIQSVEPFIETTLKDEKVWFQCKQCHYGSAKCDQLVRHIRVSHQKTHSQDRQFDSGFRCEWPECAKRFSDAYKLKEHQLTHYRKLITTVGSNNKSSMNLIFDLNKSDDKTDNSIIIRPISDSNDSVLGLNGQIEGLDGHNNAYNSMTFNVSDEQTAQHLSPKKVVMSIKNVEQYVERRKIDGITRYFCRFELCSYSSNKSNHLVRHIRTHTNDRPFMCDFFGCGKKFADIWKLRDHQMCHNLSVSTVNSCSTPESSLALVPVSEDHKPTNYVNYTPNPNSLLIQSLCSPIPTLPTLPLPVYDKSNVKPKTPVDVVMSIKNVEQYVERRKVNGITFYYCKWTDCNYGSNKSNHLVRHVRSHTGERPYECDECEKKFTDSWKLKDHKSIHTKKQLEKSMNEQRLALINYFHNQNDLQNQKAIDFGENSVNPNQTSIDLEEKPSLDLYSSEQSLNRMDDNSEEMSYLVPQVIIDESDETFVNLNCIESVEPKVSASKQSTDDSLHGILSIKNVEQYVEKVVKSDGNWYECKWNGCAFTTQKSSYIVQHIYKHTGQRPYKCKECDAKFNKKQNLTLHMMSHTGAKPFKCHYPNCYYMAITSEALKLHFQKHSGDKPFQCGWDKCSAQFATGIELLRHTKAHTGVRLHKCHFPNCSYASKYRNKLTIHLRRHTNDRPFKCEFENCGKSFIVKDKLRRHEMSVHKIQIQQSVQQFQQTVQQLINL